MKRVLALALALIMVLAGCAGGSQKTEKTSGELEQNIEHYIQVK